MRSRARRYAAALVGTALALTLAACGVPTGGPHALSPDQVPPNLLSSPSPVTPTTIKAGVKVQVFLVAPDQTISPVDRILPVPAKMSSVIGALLGARTKAELANGYSSAIPPDTQLLNWGIDNGIVTLDFNQAFNATIPQNQIVAVEQIVYTVAYQWGQSFGVLFEIDGQPVDVPGATGEAVARPVHISDYPNASPNTPPPTTPPTTAPPNTTQPPTRSTS